MPLDKKASAEAGGKIAVLGANTAEGARVREALEAARVPGSAVDLFGESQEEVLLGEYAGEARLIQAPTEQELDGHRAMLICERGAWADLATAGDRAGRTVIDLVGALPQGATPTLLRPDAAEPYGGEGVYAVPHPLSLVLFDLLGPVERGPGVEEAIAVVVRPAADYGEAGIEELRQQTVRLLNFAEMPVETFGRQLAFNVVPDTALSCTVPGLEAEISRQVMQLCRWDRERLALRFLAAPLFYGHGVELRLRTPNGAALDDVRQVLSADGLEPGAGGPRTITTPMEVADERAVHLGDVSDDGLGGFWLWAVAGRCGARAAEMAADLARRAIGR